MRGLDGACLGCPAEGHQRCDASRARGWRAELVLAALVAVFVLTAFAASASALIVHVHGRAFSIVPTRHSAAAHAVASKPKAAKDKLVTYHGGPVMPSNTNYAFYWDPTGAPEYPAGYQAGLNRWFEDLAHDSGGLQNTDSVLTQYGDQAGEFANYDSHFAGEIIDDDPYPANGCSAASICLTDDQLHDEIVRYVEAHKLPMDLQHEYFMLTPPGVESCFEAAGDDCSAGTSHAEYCAYHSFVQTESAVLIYADNPYVAGLDCDVGEEHPNDNPSDATLAGGLAHEHSESVTDPELDAWYDSKGEEVADKCRTFRQATEFGEPLGKAPDGSNYNQVINGDLYWYQQEWSNDAGACEQRAAIKPTVSKLSPKSGSPTGGTRVTITGTDFSAPATVMFGGAEATEVVVNSATSISATSPAGSGKVDVTVTTPSGTSAANKKARFKYKGKK